MIATPTLAQSIGQAETALRALVDSLVAKTGTTFVQWG
jgi:hypothetical protein